MNLLRLGEAASELGVSYPTLKQWIYRGKVDSVKTPGGHHRIPRSEVDRLAAGNPRRSTGQPRAGGPAISGRNKLRGKVVGLRYEGLLAEVRIDVGGQIVTSIITRAAGEEMHLRVGVNAAALVKATEVMVIRE